MLIDEMVSFCNDEYKNQSCSNCTGKCNSCKENCKECLDDLHFHTNKIRDDYDCEHLLNYYVCRYSYKYCSEIMYALESIDLSAYPFFHILSLGCGGACDLMAFDAMNTNKTISYIGFDKNKYWQKIHNEIIEKSPTYKVQFFREIDVLNNLTDCNIRGTNVLVIEYLISFFYSKIGDEGVKRWFGELVKTIISQKSDESPLLVIINDVDSCYTGRDTFPFLKTEIEKLGMTVNYEFRRRFKDNQYYENSIQYPSKANKFTLPSFADDYCVAIKCESSQLILEVI